MVELVDTQDLESCEATRASSILVIRTKLMKMLPNIGLKIGTINKEHLLCLLLTNLLNHL